MNQRKCGVVLSYISIVVNALIGFAYVPLLLNLMGESEYGLYQLMGSLIAYLSIMDFGMSSTVIRYYSRYRSLGDEEGAENSLALSSIIYGVITVIIIVAGVALYFCLDEMFRYSLSESEMLSAKSIFCVQLINISITIPSKVFDAVIISFERFVFLKGATIIQTVLTPIAVILILQEYPYALSFVVIQTVFNILLIAVKVIYCFGKLRIKIKMHYLSGTLFKEMLGFSFFIFLGALMDQLFWNTNKLVLGIVASTVVTAVYGVATTIFNAYMSISTVITSVFLPRVTAITTKDYYQQELSDLFIRIGRVQYLLLSCVLSGFTLFGKQFVEIWAGKGFSDVYLITLCLIVPFTIDLIQNIGITILQAENKLAFRSLTFLVASIVNILLSFYMASRFGAVGCAFSTGLTFFAMNILLNIYYAKCIHLNIGEFWKQIGKITISCIFAMLFGILIRQITFGDSFFNLAIKILIYCLVFFILMWFFALNEYEKDLIRLVFRRLRKKNS